MALPLSYSLRNLLVRRAATAMTIVGVGLAVALYLTVGGLKEGMKQVNRRTGSQLDLIVLRKGPRSETESSIELELVQRLRTLPGIAETGDRRPLLSAEIVTTANHPRRGASGSSNVTIRGVQEQGPALRTGFRIVEGRAFRPGLHEIVVGRPIARRFRDLDVGSELPCGNDRLQVVGIFEAGGTAYESEIWGDFEVIRQVFHRDQPSSVLLRAASAGDVATLLDRIENDANLALNPQVLPEYFDKQNSSIDATLAFTQFLALVLGIGAIFAAANTMYAAVAQRGAEIGILRALGFRRGSVLAAFLFESSVLGLLGGAFGTALAFLISLSGWQTGMTNWSSFTELSFGVHLSPGMMAGGLVFGVVVGGLGGLFPALQAARRPLREALRTL